MADSKITALTELTAPDWSDVLAIIDDPSGSPVTKKILLSYLLQGTVIWLTAGENLSQYDVLYISAANTVKKVTGTLTTIIGVALQAITSGNSVPVLVVGKTTVTCSGAVAVGDLLIGAATGKVAKFTANSLHLHYIETGTETISTSFETSSDGIPQGGAAGAKIIGKALTAGTNTTITAYINIAG